MPRPPRSRRRGLAVPLAAAAASMVLVLLLGSGWVVGRSAALREPAAERTPVAAWTGTGGVLHADESSAQRLRAEGWTLPTLASDGYRVRSMTQGSLAGRPAVTIELQRGASDVVVVEQRGDVDAANPVDGLTGLPVSAGDLQPSAVAGVALWADPGPPWRVVLAGDDVVYTVSADTGPSSMSHVVALVVADERGRVAGPVEDEPGVLRTIGTGLREIFGGLGPEPAG
ncbi:hypothetical protein MRU69_03155 [Kocuria flava]|uniref:hypothetical protein n=1 Tax=Kocuria flava TaxID=446860 RepID=UPI001FF1C664|nr:hypothetical protein [Kocuria flava]MCJ8503864.1 hypothetical protein [Kocuria flava]